MRPKNSDVTYNGTVLGDRGIYRLSVVKEVEYPGKDEMRLNYLPLVLVCGENIDEAFAEEVLQIYLKKLNDDEVKNFLESE